MENFSEQLKFLQELNTYIDNRAKELLKLTQVDRYESETTKELYEAISNASGEFPTIHFNRKSTWFEAEYTDLDNIMSVIRPILARHGLHVEFSYHLEDKTILITKVCHKSGEWKSSRTRFIPSKNDQKTEESALNHVKRQQIQALLNITVSGDYRDDDAVLEMSTHRDETLVVEPATKISVNSIKDADGRTITKEQCNELQDLLKDFPRMAENFLQSNRIQHVADLPYSKYKRSAELIRERILRAQGVDY